MRIKEQQDLHYYAIFEPVEEGGYNVSFPLFPGCITFGKNFEEAKEKAEEVLELWLTELEEENKKIPFYSKYPIVYEIPAKRTIIKKRNKDVVKKRIKINTFN